MFVHGFGGSWFSHPFWRGKFLVENEEDAEKIRQSSASYVLIDVERGAAPADPQPVPERKVEAPAAKGKAQRTSRAAEREMPPEHRPMQDIAAERREADKRAAQALVQRSKKVMKVVFDGARLGRAVRVQEVSSIVDEVSESVARNRHALLGVTRLKDKDEYTYLHSVAVCTLMVNMAQHLGLEAATVREYGMAGLLHDIGKMGIPEEVLNKPGRLTDEEFALVRGHPEFGHKQLLETADIPEAALDVCLHHHEKIDGTGYPFGLPADQISLAARIGAICDVYDALTSDRIYKQAWTPPEALAAMWSWEGHFEPALLFAFMQSIGVFPVGMLVRLRSNRLGVVLENQRRHSRPRACAFFATRERTFIDPEIIVIKDDLAGDQIIGVEEPRHWGFTNWPEMAELLAAGGDPRTLVTDALAAE